MTTTTDDSVDHAPVTDQHADSPVRICILQRGWVFVGYYSRDNETGECVLSGARNIRRWGTANGLGELIDGPLDDTVLDSAGTVEFHRMTEVASIAASRDGWAGHLG